MSENKSSFVIDVDVVIDKYNADNPEKEKLNRKELAKQLGMNVQIFTDWSSGKKTPKLVGRLLKLKEIGNCEMEDFIKKT